MGSQDSWSAARPVIDRIKKRIENPDEPWDSSFIPLADSMEIWLDGWPQGKDLLNAATIGGHDE